MSNFIDEYLVKLGFAQDQVGYRRFEQALREASTMVDANALNMARSALRIETSLVGAFAAIGIAAVGMVDKVAMADQEYRLFALHMFMTKDAARSLKVAMDALGQPLENLTWDPELRERTRQLIEDQRELARGLGPDFDENMRKIRDVRFEFTRLEVEFKYLSFALVNDIFKAFGGADNVLDKLRKFNDWLIKNLPDIAQKISTYVVPILKDVWRIMTDVCEVAKDFATIFDDIIGLLSGDATLQGEVTFDKFARSVEKVVHWLALATDFLLKFIGLLTGAVAGGTVGGVLGSIIGGIAGIEGGPVGIAAGIAGGGAIGTMIGGSAGAAGGGIFDLYRAYLHSQGSTTSLLQGLGGSGSENVRSLIDQAAANYGIDPGLLHALAQQESGQKQFDNLGQIIRSNKGALGVMQLMPGTAKLLGVDPSDTGQNVAGGAALLKQLLTTYHGNVAEALAAYNWNPEGVNRVLAGKATLPAETQAYVASIMGATGRTGSVQVGSVVINIKHDNPHPEEIKRAVSDGILEAQNKQTQRNLQEFQSLSWSY